MSEHMIIIEMQSKNLLNYWFKCYATSNRIKTTICSNTSPGTSISTCHNCIIALANSNPINNYLPPGGFFAYFPIVFVSVNTIIYYLYR